MTFGFQNMICSYYFYGFIFPRYLFFKDFLITESNIFIKKSLTTILNTNYIYLEIFCDSFYTHFVRIKAQRNVIEH